jgi:hypothetical protein
MWWGAHHETHYFVVIACDDPPEIVVISPMTFQDRRRDTPDKIISEWICAPQI